MASFNGPSTLQILIHSFQVKIAKRSATPPAGDLTPAVRMASYRRHVLNADVVLCTLNSSGLAWLDDLLSQVDENGDPILLAVIVDEACQATELETLIPLRWGTQKIYLVGDPKQLEPTVQSPVSCSVCPRTSQRLSRQFSRRCVRTKATNGRCLQGSTTPLTVLW